jgi:hypothetical protein
VCIRACSSTPACRRSCLSCLSWLAGGPRHLRGRGGRGRRGGPRRGGGASAAGGDPPAQQLPCYRCTSECCEHYGIPARLYHGAPHVLPAIQQGAAQKASCLSVCLCCTGPPGPVAHLLRNLATLLPCTVDLLPTRVSLRILWEMPRSIQARVLWAAARRKHPEPIVAGAAVALWLRGQRVVWF